MEWIFVDLFLNSFPNHRFLPIDRSDLVLEQPGLHESSSGLSDQMSGGHLRFRLPDHRHNQCRCALQILRNGASGSACHRIGQWMDWESQKFFLIFFCEIHITKKNIPLKLILARQAEDLQFRRRWWRPWCRTAPVELHGHGAVCADAGLPGAWRSARAHLSPR